MTRAVLSNSLWSIERCGIALKPPDQVVSEKASGAVQTVRLTEGLWKTQDFMQALRVGEEFEKPGWREQHTPNVQFVSQDLEEGKILR